MPSPDATRRTAPRAVLIALALLLAGLSVVDYSLYRRDRSALRRSPAGARLAVLPAWVGKTVDGEPDPVRARLALARALVAGELDVHQRHSLTLGNADADRRASLERLATAGELAAGALARRPAAWQAAMLLGAATYLGRSLARDPALIADSPAWDRPLTLARELAPGKEEPGRFSALVYLELWNVLSPEKRDLARGLLARAFRDQATYSQLLGLWVDIAADREEVFAVVPAQPGAWETLLRLYAERGDWDGYLATWERTGEQLNGVLEERLEQGAARRRGGEAAVARGYYLSVLSYSRPSAAHAPLVERALTEAPPGPAARTPSEVLAWLDWTLSLSHVGRRPLARPVVDRLAGMVADLPAPRAAFAAAVGAHLPQAERLEHRSPDTWSEPWGPYWLAKARELTARGHLDQAAAALDQLPAAWTDRPVAWLARRELAAAADNTADGEQAERRLAELARSRWPAAVWQPQRRLARAELLTGEPAGGLEVELVTVPAAGTVVVAQLDGNEIGAFRLEPGDRLRLPVGIEPGLHLLELRTVAGDPPVPGEIRLF